MNFPPPATSSNGGDDWREPSVDCRACGGDQNVCGHTQPWSPDQP